MRNLVRVGIESDRILIRSTHPYFDEILQISYPQHIFQHARPRPPKPFEDTPFTWVATQEDLTRLLLKLRQVSEVAVDLEHHSYRSYYGFVCLMQISTREEDFIIDTLALREELEDLNEIFVDPAIVKVNSSIYLVTVLHIPPRSSMGPTAILCGCKRTSTFTLSTYSILIKHRKFLVGAYLIDT